MISNKYVALFVVGFFVYIALMILIAYLTSRKGSTKGEDYLMGGRNVGLLLLICTAAATAAVSYTHLDVYKRQGGRGGCPERPAGYRRAQPLGLSGTP